MSDEPKPPYVQFEIRAVEDRAASEEKGSAAFRDVIFAIVTPAGTRDRLEKVAKDWIEGLEEGVKQERIPSSWLRQYRQALKDFEESRETPENGTPVRDWSTATPAQIKTLLDINIRTVEEVAAMTEEAMTYLGMGGRALKAKAQAWLDSASAVGKTSMELESLRQRNEELEAQQKLMQENVLKLQAQVETLSAAKK